MELLDDQRSAGHWATDLRELLVALPAWSLVAQRKAFVEAALGGHPAAAELSWDDDPPTVAGNLTERLAFFAAKPVNDRHPGCALLAEVRRREYDINPAVGVLVGRLSTAFGCEAPQPAASCPYPGLLAYDWGRDQARARLFFGREAETDALVMRLRDLAPGNLLVVSGASGCGKSSLVKAGLWRALHAPPNDQQESIEGSRDWLVSAMTPSFHGDAFLTLVTSADTCNPLAGLVPAREALRLRKEPEKFPGFLERLLAGRPAWLLILDQMEEVFAREAERYREDFIAFLLRAVQDPRLRLVATIRSDFLHYLNDHPELCAILNREPPYFVRAPGPQSLARLIEAPLRAVSLTCDAALTDRLVQDAHGQSGGLALLGAALEDLYAVGAATGGLTLAHYEKRLGGLAGILEQRAERGFAVLAAGFGLERQVADDLMRRVFAELVAIDPHSGEATRRRTPLRHWREDGKARAFIEVFSRAPKSREDNVRLLVCGEQEGEATVEVAHEALLRRWAPLTDWIDQRREALVRRAEVLRDAERWDKAGRPDDFLPVPGVRRDVRRRLQAGGLWDGVRASEAAAYFLAEDDPEELADLTRRAFIQRGSGPNPLRRALRLLFCLAAPGRSWETSRALGEWIAAQEPVLAAWLRDGLGRVLRLLSRNDSTHWHRRRLGIGDLLAILGDDRPGVGLRPDGLPDIDWIDIAPGPFSWQESETRTIDKPYRIARYPVTNAQYQAFIEAADYGDAAWWQPGTSKEAYRWRWDQPNRPRVAVDWLEAMAFCRWLTARCHEARLIGADQAIRLPTEREWERAARGTDGRDYPWGAEYRAGYANTDETTTDRDGLFLRETTAVGLYSRGASPDGLLDCAGNVWEWCLNRYADPDDPDTTGDGDRSLRGGSWNGSPANARAAYRSTDGPEDRSTMVGFRLVCACPIDSEH
jgi:formylglycine-generating enzyme required for sulfatase activity